MKKYLLKRIASSLVTFFLISVALFALVRVIPGNPFPTEKMTQEQIEAKRESMGLNDPIPVQYVRYMGNLLKGDLGTGTSLYSGAPIKTVLGTCIKNSFMVGGLAILIGTLLGMLLGILAALHRNHFLDHFCSFISLLGICMPSYIFMIYFQRFFAFKLAWLPVFFDVTQPVASAILPALSMSMFAIATIAKFTRNEMIDVMGSDFVQLAELKGMEGSMLIRRHVLKNTLIPIITVIAPIVVDLLTGASVIEKIYGINGIGKLMVDAISGTAVDYNYILILGMLYSGLYITVMLILDLLYGLIDPRIKVAKQG